MKKKLRCIDILTSDGKLIFSLRMYDKESTQEEKTDIVAEQLTAPKKETDKNQGQETTKEKEPEKEKTETPNPQPDEPLMTDAQKRYLFRLLVDQGVEGEQAHERLKSLFQVTALTEVTKGEASKMIERLIEENKGGKNNGSPLQQPNQSVPAV